MKNSLTYYYSACVGINVESLSILCDPWFTDGAYYGSWYQYPKLIDPINKIPEYKYIYISHLHEDHLDIKFLKSYLAKWPESKIIITKRKFDYLSKILNKHGLKFLKVNSVSSKDAVANLIPYLDNNKEEIDSVLEVISFKSEYRIINLNDVPFNEVFHESIAQRPFEINCLLAGYSGAGPYPQTYFEITDPLIKKKSKEKENKFVERFLRLCEIYNARCNIPFAGTYYLGGKLSYLNQYRGIPDPVTLKKYRKDIIVPADGGNGLVSLDEPRCDNQRNFKYDYSEIEKYLSNINYDNFLYEKNIEKENYLIDEIPQMLDSAFDKALRIFDESRDISCTYEFLFGNATHKLSLGSKSKEDYSLWSIYIHPNLLYGILKGYYHWDTAEIGSHIKVRRKPDIYSRKAHKFLCFLRI